MGARWRGHILCGLGLAAILSICFGTRLACTGRDAESVRHAKEVDTAKWQALSDRVLPKRVPAERSTDESRSPTGEYLLEATHFGEQWGERLRRVLQRQRPELTPEEVQRQVADFADLQQYTATSGQGSGRLVLRQDGTFILDDAQWMCEQVGPDIPRGTWERDGESRLRFEFSEEGIGGLRCSWLEAHYDGQSITLILPHSMKARFTR